MAIIDVATIIDAFVLTEDLQPSNSEEYLNTFKIILANKCEVGYQSGMSVVDIIKSAGM